MKRQNITPYNINHQPHGLWLCYYNSIGNLDYKGHFINDKEYGYWIDNLIFHNYLVTFFIK